MQTIYAFSYNPVIATGTNTTGTNWRMAYQQPIMLYKGTANQFRLVVFSVNQKVVNLTNYDVQVQIVDRETKEHFVTKTATITAPASGVATITFTEEDLRYLQHRFYHLIARLVDPDDGSSVSSGEILYLDDNYGAFTPITIEDAWNYNPTATSTIDGVPNITFTNIGETPDSFASQAGLLLKVNSTENGIEFSNVVSNITIGNLNVSNNLIETSLDTLEFRFRSQSIIFEDNSTDPDHNVGDGGFIRFNDLTHLNDGPRLEIWYGEQGNPNDPAGQHSLDIRAAANSYVELASYDLDSFIGIDAVGPFIQTQWQNNPSKAWRFLGDGELRVPTVGSKIATEDGLLAINMNFEDIRISRVDRATNEFHTTLFDGTGDVYFDGDLLPGVIEGPDLTPQHSLGTIDRPWKDLYVSNSTIYLGNVALSIDNTGNLLVDGNVITGGGGSTSQPYLELTNNPLIVQAAVLGEPFEFTRTADGSQTDEIDTGLTLARSSNQALYNIEAEIEYDNNTYLSPLGTEWNNDGWGDLLNLESRSYTTFRSALNNQVGNNILEAELVMHDTINDKYYKFEFTDWGQNNGGSFAYTRTQITNPNYFLKPDNSNLIDTFVENDDSTLQIGITRDANNGIYNPYRENGWDSDVSPLGTLWNIAGWDDLTNLEDRTYLPFYEAYGNGGLGNKVPGSKAIMYIPDTDQYFGIYWLSWTQGGGGGFSYLRYEIDRTKLNEGIKFVDGTILKSAEGLGRVKLRATDERRIEEAVGYKQVSVTERITQTSVAATAFDTRNDYYTFINWDVDLYTLYDGPTDYELEFSLDNSTWYPAEVVGSSTNNFLQLYHIGDRYVSVTQGDTVYYRVSTGAEPVVWWDKNDLSGGSDDFRGAIIDYHAFTGDATIIGTIHIVDDDGEENITHTEVSSGSTDGENDDLWFVQNEGTISYRRLDGEVNTLKIQWTAKIFYGSEYNND
jgi:hypothetical protein